MANTIAPSTVRPSTPPNATIMKITTAQVAGPSSSSKDKSKAHHLGLGMFSPVNQNGSFEFDRVLKSGEVMKRTRKTKNWKTVYLVLRPHTLSIYKDRDETRLRHQIALSELTAVARQRDSAKRAKHVFGLFSPSRNFHLAALSDNDAQDWVELIRRESRIDEEEEEMMQTSPPQGRNAERGRSTHRKLREQMLSSSSEGEGVARPSSSVKPEGLHSARRPSHNLAYSGNEQASFSDFSDTPGPSGFRDSTLSFSQPNDPNTTYDSSGGRPSLAQNVSQMSTISSAIYCNPQSNQKPDDERVICQGWLYILKSKGGVRQWKKLWAVLRPRALGLYKNEEEYSATLILPFPSLLNAVEIDPISKSKRFCLQLIAEERNYRLCAPDEDALAKWLGALKSLLAKRKEVELQRQAAAAAAEKEKERDAVAAATAVAAGVVSPQQRSSVGVASGPVSASASTTMINVLVSPGPLAGTATATLPSSGAGTPVNHGRRSVSGSSIKAMTGSAPSAPPTSTQGFLPVR
ncbi:uncharacterized protein J3D65DRAFT_132210 [Phyllosticta citribraziliensis]|uniref:PH domain-containing protein n=1 Tax=Phyllosticta citribraziliensis TaxID=989973 RepID=A0ABR1L609_9PEZI